MARYSVSVDNYLYFFFVSYFFFLLTNFPTKRLIFKRELKIINTFKTQFINGIAYSQMLTTMEYKLAKKEAERRKVSSGLTSLSVFALVILISFLSARSSIVPSRRKKYSTSSTLFLRKAAYLLPSAVKCIVRVSEWTNDVVSQSFAF